MKRIMIITQIIFSLVGCNYGSNVKIATEENFLKKKQFFRQTMLKGIILNKNFCDYCEINRFRINIKLDSLSCQLFSFQYYSFQPYYFFENGKGELQISVTKEIFNVISVGNIIEKKMNSDSVQIGDNYLKLISEQKYKWFPSK